MAGLSLILAGGTGANNQSSPDVITPLHGATPLFQYSATKVAGLFMGGAPTEVAASPLDLGKTGPGPKHAAAYRLVYLAFGFEGISNATVRNDVMARAMNLLDGACDLHRLRVTGDTITWQPAAGRFDLVRGDLANVTESAGAVNLGAVTCVGENLTSALATDGIQPLPDQTFFYLARRDGGSWGVSSAGNEEVPASGACP